ncbi:MAG: hypothetical protein V9F05_06105 [Chitinophagaceae bacterium]
MNFLSHFYHELPVSDPNFAAGLILPDILSNYSYRTGEVVKLHPQKLVYTDNPELNSMTEGVKRHYFVDGHFHELTFFEQNTTAISALIKATGFSCFDKRLYAISHVLLEVVLDRTLLTSRPEVCKQLYDLIEIVDTSQISRLVANNTQAMDPDGIGNHFKVFRERKFLYDYAYDERLTGIINGINIRLGNPPMNETDQNRFKIVIHDIEKTILSQKFPKFPTNS